MFYSRSLRPACGLKENSMPELIPSAAETACTEALSKSFEEGKFTWDGGGPTWEPLGVTDENVVQVHPPGTTRRR